MSRHAAIQIDAATHDCHQLAANVQSKASARFTAGLLAGHESVEDAVLQLRRDTETMVLHA
jgi:hypothetical protein